MFDLIIKNGKIADGTGNDSYIADIGVKDGVIAKIGAIVNEKAEKEIDAKGKLVTPGFIDMHSHGDQTMNIFPEMESKLIQGITTIVGGQCGYTLAPNDGYWASPFISDKVADDVEPSIYGPKRVHPFEKVGEKLKSGCGLDISWRTFGEYLKTLEDMGFGVNFVPLVGHGQIRAQVMGEDHKRPATSQEILKMQEYLEEAMESGAHGMSVGLDYVPGIYADFNELLGVAGILKKYNGTLASHWRRTGQRTGTPKKLKKIDGIIETLELGKELGIHVQISHLFPGFDVYPERNAYMAKAAAEATLQVIDGYVEKGVDVGFDVIPDVSVSRAPLFGLFKPWVKQSGSLEQFIKNLKANDYKARMVELINAGGYYTINPIRWPDWDVYFTIIDSVNKSYVGSLLSDIARSKGKSPVETVFDLLIEDPAIKVEFEVYDLTVESVKTFLMHPLATVGTDTVAYNVGGKPGMKPNTRMFSRMTKYLTVYGAERIEDTIRKVTGKNAETLGLKDRGFIKEGQKADILVIDTENLRTNDTIEPFVLPEGMEYVIVNGKVAVDKGSFTGARAGKVLRKIDS